MNAFDRFLSRNKSTLILATACILLALSGTFFFANVRKGFPHVAIAACCVFGIAILIAIFFALKKNVAIERVFFVLFLGFGLVYLFMFSPIKMADEQSHYKAAYTYSNILLGQDSSSENLQIRKDDHDFIAFWSADRRDFHDDFKQVKEMFSLFQTTDEMVDYDTDGTVTLAARPPQLHIVPALGLTLGRLLGLGSIPTYYLARLLNLLALTFCGFYALRRMPYGKTTLLVIFLLPITLEICSSLSYDGPIIMLAALFASETLNAQASREPLTIGHMVRIIVFGILLAPCKMIYTLLLILAFFIPAANFSGKRQRFIFMAILCLTSLVAIYIIDLAFVSDVAADGDKWNSSGHPGSKDYVPSYTLSMALEDPLHAIWLIANTAINNASRHVQGIFGGVLGWTQFSGPWYVVIAFSIITMLSLLADKTEMNIRPSARLAYILCFLLGALGIYGSMMVGWITIEDKTIVGIQGRYFIPLLPLLLASLIGLANVTSKTLSKILIMSCTFMNAFYCMYILVSIINS